jgi:hypothetical protein
VVSKKSFGWFDTSLLIVLCLFLLFILISYASAQIDKAPPQKSDKSTSVSEGKSPQTRPDLQLLLTANSTTTIIYVIAILVLKLTAFFMGFKTIVMGHDLLIKGIKGDFDFTFTSNSTISTKLQSASPGTFFVLLGTALIAWGLFVAKPLEIRFSIGPDQQVQTVPTDSTSEEKIKIENKGHGPEKPSSQVQTVPTESTSEEKIKIDNRETGL